MTSIRATVQDQNQSTVEPFRLGLRGEEGHGSGVPMNGPRGGIFQDTLTLPVGPATPGAWVVTVSTGSPVVIPELRSIFVGVGQPATPAWMSDGLSVHMASYALGTSGENPRAGAPDHSICVAQPGDRVLGSASPRTLAVDVLTAAPRLDVGTRLRCGEDRTRAMASPAPIPTSPGAGTASRSMSQTPRRQVQSPGCWCPSRPRALPCPRPRSSEACTGLRSA